MYFDIKIDVRIDKCKIRKKNLPTLSLKWISAERTGNIPQIDTEFSC